MIDVAPAVLEEIGPERGICRCGTVLPPKSRRLRLVEVPPSVAAMFDDRPFCSGRCIRAYFLETLETFDAIYSGRSAEGISDLHVVYQAVAKAFAAVLLDSSLQS